MADPVPFNHPWSEDTIGNKADVIVGGTPSTAVARYWGGNVPWMASGDVHLRRIADVPGRITDVGLRASAAKMVEPPAIAVALAGQGKTRGTSALTEIAICTNQSVALIKPRNEELDAHYLYYALDYRYEELRARSAGGGRAGLTKQIVQNVPVPLPHPNEQSRIAEILDTLDAAIRETEAMLAKLRQVKAGLLHDLLTRGIDEHGHFRDPKRHPEQFQDSPLGPIPRAWAVHRLSEVAVISSGVTLGRDVHGTGSVDLPYLRVANVQDGYLELSEVKTVRVLRSEVEAFRLHVGDVLMNEGGDFDKLGRGAVWRGGIDPCLHQNHVFKVRPDQRRILPDFLAAVSGSRIGKMYFLNSSKQSTNLASINSTQLKAFLVPCPQVEEQTVIQRSLALAEARIVSEESRLSKLHFLKRGLAHDLLTGRVRVRNNP